MTALAYSSIKKHPNVVELLKNAESSWIPFIDTEWSLRNILGTERPGVRPSRVTRKLANPAGCMGKPIVEPISLQGSALLAHCWHGKT